jgi:hypothetical protein
MDVCVQTCNSDCKVVKGWHFWQFKAFAKIYTAASEAGAAIGRHR